MNIEGDEENKEQILNVEVQCDICFWLQNKTLKYTSCGSTLAYQKSALIDFCGSKQKIFCKVFSPIFHISLWSPVNIKINDILGYYLPVSARRLGMMAGKSTHIEND